MGPRDFPLRYGANPHQAPARAYVETGSLPLSVLNGTPSYINLLDALNSWQLVREMRHTLRSPAAASFKHVSPAGAAVATPLDDALKKAYFVDDLELSPLATAYARARGADRVSAFGDWIALSDPADAAAAQLIAREVSDGVIAPAYDEAAVRTLSRKRGGKYVVLQIDPAYEPDDRETRRVFGITLEQPGNAYLPSPADLGRIVTRNSTLPDAARRDAVIALLAAKYTQSNSVCLAFDGQVIGVGAGQQSRIHCLRLAAAKADTWRLRQHPRVLGLRFAKGLSRPDRDNAIDQYLQEDLTPAERKALAQALRAEAAPLGADEKRAWLQSSSDVVLASDGFIPFRDTIDRASESGVGYVVQPGGSVRDDEVIGACDEYGMVMIFSGVRLFLH